MRFTHLERALKGLPGAGSPAWSALLLGIDPDPYSELLRIAALARATGITGAAVLHHFGSKENLLFEALVENTHAPEQWFEQLPRPGPAGPAREGGRWDGG